MTICFSCAIRRCRGLSIRGCGVCTDMLLDGLHNRAAAALQVFKKVYADEPVPEIMNRTYHRANATNHEREKELARERKRRWDLRRKYAEAK